MPARSSSVAPDHPDALHYAGVLAHQHGRSDEALALIERSLELAPDQPDWYSNLGIVLQARGDLEGAIEAYRRAIALDPAHANAHSNLGVLLRVQRELDEAEAAYRTRHRARIPSTPTRTTTWRCCSSATGPHAGGGDLLLQGADAEAALSGGAARAGAGLLHARRARQGHRRSARSG